MRYPFITQISEFKHRAFDAKVRGAEGEDGPCASAAERPSGAGRGFHSFNHPFTLPPRRVTAAVPGISSTLTQGWMQEITPNPVFVR
jgi:hypothetical protein